jgi:hypothetical protein
MRLSDEGQTDLEGMGMGVLRWLFGSHRSDADEDDEEERTQAWKKSKRSARGNHSPNSYRIEVDGEPHEFRGEGAPFSFWSSARIILILSFLLWWIQPAGPMIAGYVGGRRSGSAMKGVVAALLPVAIIFLANLAYSRGVASYQIDFVASLPQAVAGAIAGILPFLTPYKDFLISYLTGFVKALQSTFGMGTNGYLMVIIFAYIGGLIADQTRRELYYRNGARQSVGLNLIQPLFSGRRAVEESEYDDEDEELQELRRPVRGRARSPLRVKTESRRRHGANHARFDDYRSLLAETAEGHTNRHPVRARSREDDEEPEEEDEESTRRVRGPHVAAKEHRERAHVTDDEADEDAEATSRRESQEVSRPRQRSHEEEVAIQRFVERALRQYEHPAR